MKATERITRLYNLISEVNDRFSRVDLQSFLANVKETNEYDKEFDKLFLKYFNMEKLSSLVNYPSTEPERTIAIVNSAVHISKTLYCITRLAQYRS